MSDDEIINRLYSIPKIGKFNKAYIQIVKDWQTCSDNDVKVLKKYVGSIFNEKILSMGIAEQSAMNYLLVNSSNNKKIIVNHKTLDYGFIDVDLDILENPGVFVVFE
jgi:hypothetical protein